MAAAADATLSSMVRQCCNSWTQPRLKFTKKKKKKKKKKIHTTFQVKEKKLCLQTYSATLSQLQHMKLHKKLFYFHTNTIRFLVNLLLQAMNVTANSTYFIFLNNIHYIIHY